MRVILLLKAALVLGGCVVTWDPMLDADGEPMWVITCDGLLQKMQACFQQAAELCPSGYRLLDSSQEVGALRGDIDDSFSQDVMRVAYVRCEKP